MKFLICGMGSIGLRHVRNLKLLGFHDIVIFSSGKSVMPGAKKEVENCNIYSSLDDALSEKPDVCMITNPTSMHIDVALKAANSNCHLYIEKPISHSLEKLDILKKVVDKKGLITFVTYQFRFHPHIILLKAILNDVDGFYGKPLYVTTEWSEYLPDWHPWEDYRQSYSARKDLGGGVLLTQIHPVNYLHYIFGNIHKLQINKVATRTLNIDVDDLADLLISFENGMGGHVHVDFLQKPRVHTMKVLTTKGRFEWDYHKNLLIFIDREGKEKTFLNEGFERNDMFLAMLRDFIDCVNRRQKTKFNLDEAIAELEKLV